MEYSVSFECTCFSASVWDVFYFSQGDLGNFVDSKEIKNRICHDQCLLAICVLNHLTTFPHQWFHAFTNNLNIRWNKKGVEILGYMQNILLDNISCFS